MEYTLWTWIQGTVVQWLLGGDHDLGSNPWSTISLLYSPWTHTCPCLQVPVFFTSFLLCQCTLLTLGYSLPGISSSSGVIHFPPQRLHPWLCLKYFFFRCHLCGWLPLPSRSELTFHSLRPSWNHRTNHAPCFLFSALLISNILFIIIWNYRITIFFLVCHPLDCKLHRGRKHSYVPFYPWYLAQCLVIGQEK